MPNAVHESRRVFEAWPLPKFQTNLGNLRDALACDYNVQILKDCRCHEQDDGALMVLQFPFIETPWHLSAAKPLWVRDVRVESMMANISMISLVKA